MTLKQFKTLKIIMVIILAIIVGQSVVYHNYFIPIIAMVLAILVLFYFRGRVKEIIADERDYEVGGKAARLAIQIFSWLAVVGMLAFLAYSDSNPSFGAIAFTLAYSVCFLMILYAFLFRYYNKIAFLEKKMFYIIVGLLILFFLLIFGARFLSGEDDWICQDGQWVKHGMPSFSAPSIECKK